MLTPDALHIILEKEDPVAYTRGIITETKPDFCIIDHNCLPGRSRLENKKKNREEMEEMLPDRVGPEMKARSVPDKKGEEKPPIVDYIINGNIDEFNRYFLDRYRQYLRMFKARQNLPNFRGDPDPENQDTVSFVGTIQEIRTTKKSHQLILKVDTPNKTVTIFYDKNKNPLQRDLIEDDTVCFTGNFLPKKEEYARKGNDPLFYLKNVTWPGFPLMNRPRLWKKKGYAAFIGDIHAGSKHFLHEEWADFIAWLNSGDEIPKNLKHLVIAGDLVEGVGIYPNQKKDLTHVTHEEQYRILGSLLKGVPEHVEIHAIPGNHDAVPISEPQPPIPPIFQSLITRKINYLSNPDWIGMDGFNVLAYHGVSIFDFISKIPQVTINEPMLAMDEMLTRRHLAPCYGGHTSLLPLPKDHHVIDKIPNIFVTGHLHVSKVEVKNGIIMINASAWQSQTDYQKMQNFHPNPAKVAVVDLQKGKPQVIDFAR